MSECFHVLVVDDVQDNRAIYTAYLGYHGFEVDEAVNGEDALVKIAAKRPDVVVMDLAMPVLDGWEATKRIKSDDRTKDIVIVAITGHAFGDNVKRAHDLGADAVLMKPCSPESLLEVMRHLLSR